LSLEYDTAAAFYQHKKLKSRVIRGINSERQKWPIRKASDRWQKWWLVGICCVLPEFI